MFHLGLWVAMACATTAPEPASEPVEDIAAATVGEPARIEVADRMAATHVLVAYKDSVGSVATRTKDEAQSLAQQLAKRARDGEAMEDLARAHSDGPSGRRGGGLGVFAKGTMVPAFETEVARLTVGDIGIAETPFGFHVIRRDEVVEVRVAHLVVGFEGARGSKATRSKADARRIAEEALAAVKGGEPFTDVAKRVSEDTTGTFGGALGWIAPGQMVPDFEEAAFALDVSELSDVVETPQGFHVIRRLE